MEYIIELLTGYGYWGMFLAAFLAGSIFPFSSETVMLGLWAAGLDPWQLTVFGSAGNVLGSMFNYGIGRMGRLDWLERWFHLKHETLMKAEKFMGTRGAFMGFFCFLPVLGSAIAVALGLTRANIIITIISVTVGKFVRYWLLVYGANFIASVF